MKYNIADTINELYRIFNVLNEHYFENRLEDVVITIVVEDGVYGYLKTPKVWTTTDSDDFMFEIGMNPEYFDRDVNEIVGVLLHEMVHLDNQLNGIKDTTKAGKHNKKFKQTAEAVDLIVDEDDFGITDISPQLNKFISDIVKPDEDCFKLYIEYPVVEVEEPKPRKKTQFKYICPKCGMVAKAKAELNIVCGACNATLEMEDVEQEEETILFEYDE